MIVSSPSAHKAQLEKNGFSNGCEKVSIGIISLGFVWGFVKVIRFISLLFSW